MGSGGCVIERVILAEPRGFCAGVIRAIDTVEEALGLFGPPVYVRRQIVHNPFVVRDLERKGAVFVEEVEEVPPGALLVFSAHGVAPSVRAAAEARRLRVIDATCPLVTKVHLEAVRYARLGYSLVLVGHAGHDEVIGTMGEVPDHIHMVGTREEAEALQ
ncbi:MAG: 4-hydroxy-3-methylbut-2-enyl diphosphate reductase, partial [Chloroflexi bacterium]|nr:4-hydroxy-3-methylbut-2-enyl diphosphate reductase [Chloroflexota bacterium]